jgi:cerevisin
MKLSLLTTALLLAGYATAAPFQTTSPTLAPLYTNTETDSIPESYIVVLKNHVDEAGARAHCGWVNSFHNDDPLAASLLDPTVAAGIKHTFNLPTVSGYTGKFSDRTVERIRSSPDVSNVTVSKHVLLTAA